MLQLHWEINHQILVNHLTFETSNSWAMAYKDPGTIYRKTSFISRTLVGN